MEWCKPFLNIKWSDIATNVSFLERMPPSVRKSLSFRLRGRPIRLSGFIIFSLFVVFAPYYLSGQFVGLTAIDESDNRSSGTKALPARANLAFEALQDLLPKEVVDAVQKAEEAENSIFLDSQRKILPNEQDLGKIENGGVSSTSDLGTSRDIEREEVVQSRDGTKNVDSESEMNGRDMVSKSTVLSEVKEDEASEQSPVQVNTSDPAWQERKDLRLKRQEKRLKSLTTLPGSDESALSVDEEQTKMATQARLSPPAGVSQLGQKYSIWQKEGSEGVENDRVVRLIRDQLIMARSYMSIARQNGDTKTSRELKAGIKDSLKSLGDATQDLELPSSALERMRLMGQLLAKARKKHYDCTAMVQKLRAMVQSAEDQTMALKKQSTYLSQVAAKTIPRGINCLSLRLTTEYFSLTPEKREFPGKDKLEDRSLYHYALFSDNVLAAAVVVNSTVMNALDSSKHVFHIVTDKLNYGAMKMWFLLNPPKMATVEVASVDDFKWLNASYCPVLQQLESASMKAYYFKAAKIASGTEGQLLKYRNPKYLSMLNHLRFYLPEVYPKLEKILFVDDDIVVQEDLTPLWEVDLNGNVNGAILTCGESFHRYDKYLNFSHPLISANFNPQACGWAYGMNVFDLKAWRERDMTGIYHYWQRLNEDRQLWKLGTLPPGLITFYNVTQPLKKSWHALGLGYNPELDTDELDSAAVVHYNGNMKPWLEIGMAKFKPYWTKYVKYDHPFLQQCNINE